MDKIEEYRTYIKKILTGHAQRPSTVDTIKAELFFDDNHNHYQLYYVGWQEHN